MSTIFHDGTLQIKKLPMRPFDNNCYIILCTETKESIIVDTPEETERILAEVQGTTVRAILITHGHGDHTVGLKDIKAGTRAPIGAHPSDANRLPLPPDMPLKDGQALSVGTLKVKALHTPGHTPGSTCFLVGRYLLSGDTLFPGGPGHSSSPQALQQMISSITSKLYTLPDDVKVLPGHGQETTIAQSRQEYEAFRQRPHAPDLCGDVLWLSS